MQTNNTRPFWKSSPNYEYNYKMIRYYLTDSTVWSIQNSIMYPC